MPVFAFDLIPGEWYILITCEQCQTEHVLFPDLTHGSAKLKAIYTWTCPSCGHRGNYEGENLRRYQHPLSAKRKPGAAKRKPARKK